jgi:hypothetical protein
MFLDDRYKKQAIEYLDNLATFGEKHLPTFMMTIGALRLWFGI